MLAGSRSTVGSESDADPETANSMSAWSHTSVENFLGHSPPSACQLQGKVCEQSTG